MRQNVSVDFSLMNDILNIQVNNKSKKFTLTKSTKIIYKKTIGMGYALRYAIQVLSLSRITQ